LDLDDSEGDVDEEEEGGSSSGYVSYNIYIFTRFILPYPYNIDGPPLREWLLIGRRAERGAELNQYNQVTETLTPEKASSADCREGRG
jgi:hypothetical protein